MAFAEVKEYFEEMGLGERVMELEADSATVEQAARAIGCEPKQIAKTLSFLIGDKAILIVAAGDAKVDNKKYKTRFGKKAKMIPRELVEDFIGHAPGGVCPFVIKEGVEVYLDKSLKRFEEVYPAAGSGRSMVRLSVEELEQCMNARATIVPEQCMNARATIVPEQCMNARATIVSEPEEKMMIWVDVCTGWAIPSTKAD